MGIRPEEKTLLVHSLDLPAQESGELLHLPREHGVWEWMSFFVRRLQPGDVIDRGTASEEAAFVILGGTCVADWGQGRVHLGKRKTVFDGLPYTLYLPAGNEVSFEAETTCEIAECRVPSSAQLQPRQIPRGVAASGPGGGENAPRQFVVVFSPAFPQKK